VTAAWCPTEKGGSTEGFRGSGGVRWLLDGGDGSPVGLERSSPHWPGFPFPDWHQFLSLIGETM
jgi:hypothetical protein